MLINFTNNKYNNRWEEGFTLIEVLVTTLIISIGLFLSFIGGTKLIKTIENISETSKFLNQLSIFENIYQEQLQQIEIPWWYTDSGIQLNSSQTTIPFLNGHKDDELIISLTEEGLIIESNLANENKDSQPLYQFFPLLKDGVLSPIGESGHTRGMGIQFTFEKETYKIYGIFGSVPIHPESEND